MSREFKVKNPIYLHLVLQLGGLGDIIHSIPALDHIFSNFPWQKYIINPPDYLVPLFKRLYPNQRVEGLSQLPKKVDGKVRGMLVPNISRHSSMHVHLTDFAFYMYTDSLPKNNNQRNLREFKPDINIKRFKLPEKYVVLSPFSRVDLREIPPAELDKIHGWIKEQGYSIVTLGNSGQVFNRSKNITTSGTKYWQPPEDCIDLCDKTNILEALEIMWGASALVTMDGGLLHLACLSPTPVVAGFTTVEPCDRIPYKNGTQEGQVYTVTPDIDCRFCQSRICCVYNVQHKFNSCYMEDKACVKEMTADKFISHLKEVL